MNETGLGDILFEAGREIDEWIMEAPASFHYLAGAIRNVRGIMNALRMTVDADFDHAGTEYRAAVERLDCSLNELDISMIEIAVKDLLDTAEKERRKK